jgi:hypothetical protein
MHAHVIYTLHCCATMRGHTWSPGHQTVCESPTYGPAGNLPPVVMLHSGPGFCCRCCPCSLRMLLQRNSYLVLHNVFTICCQVACGFASMCVASVDSNHSSCCNYTGMPACRSLCYCSCSLCVFLRQDDPVSHRLGGIV